MFIGTLLRRHCDLVAIAFVTSERQDALTLSLIAGIVGWHVSASRPPEGRCIMSSPTMSAAVDGEMVVDQQHVAGAGILRLRREHHRFDTTSTTEMTGRQRSVLYLERLRILHALFTVALTICLLVGRSVLWQSGSIRRRRGARHTLGLSVLHATRDLAVALVDVTQHVARLTRRCRHCSCRMELPDDPQAAPLIGSAASVTFDRVSFTYRDGRQIFDDLSLSLEPGHAVGLVGHSGGGKIDAVCLAATLL